MQALAYLRQSAISPARVVGIAPLGGSTSGTYDIDRVVWGNSTSATEVMASVRGRLAVMIPMRDLLAAPDANAVYERLGVSREAFVEARAYLAAEQHAFDRHPTRPLAAEPLPSSTAGGVGETTASFTIEFPAGTPVTVSNLTLYAATRLEPAQPLHAWWGALLRYDPSPQPLSGYIGTGAGPAWNWQVQPGGSVPPGFTFGTETSFTPGQPLVFGELTTAAAMESFATRAQAAVSRIEGFGALSDPVRAARDVLASTLGDIGRGAVTDGSAVGPVGRARFCMISQSTTVVSARFDVRLPGVPASRMAVVRTRDALECAVRGMSGVGAWFGRGGDERCRG